MAGESWVAKLDRAKVQSKLLGADVNALLSHRYHVRTDPYVENGREAYVVRVVTENPPTREDFIGWAIRTGEVIHNLHSALDHLAYALAGCKAGRHTAFPITDDKYAWREAVTPNKKGKCKTLGFSTDALKRIHALQPHPRSAPENQALRLLRDLSSWDKHRVLQMGVCHGYASAAEVGPIGPHHVGLSYGWHQLRPPGPFDNDTVLGYLEVPHDMEVKVDASIHIAFAEGTVAASRPVLDLLHEMAGCIESRVFPRLTSFIPSA